MNKKYLVLLSFSFSVIQVFAQNAICPSCTQPSGNYVTNGDFGLANSGFNTNLTYSASGSSSPGKYAVRSQANSFWIGGCSVTDHTSGGGTNVLCIDGRTYGLTIAWEQTVGNLQPNTNYLFSYYVKFATCVQAGIKPVLYVLMNASQVGDTITVTAGGWRKCSYLWNSGSDTNVVIQLIDSCQGGSGNDFIIDDIELSDCTTGMSANAGPDLQVCAGSPVQLTGSGTGGGTCSWSGPSYLDNYISCNPVFNSPFPGDYLYLFDYTSGACIATDSLWIHVDANPGKPVVTQSGDSLISSVAAAYQWYDSNGILSGETNRHFLPSLSGYYSVSILSAAGCQAVSDSVYFTPCSQLFSVNAGADQEVCAGSPLTLQAISGGQGTCTWSGPSGLDNYSTCNPTFNSGFSGTYIFIVTDYLSGCPASDTVSIQVNSLPAKPVISRNADTLFSTIAGSYQWFSNGTPLNGDTSQTCMPMVAGYYYVVVTNTSGCSIASDSVYFQLCQDVLVVQAPGDTAVCAGTPVSLTVSGTGSGNCVWSGPTGLDNYSICSPTFLGNNGGDYSFFVTDELYGCQAGDSVNIHVFDLPAKPMISQSADSLISTSALYYQWYFNGSLVAGETGYYIIPSQSGYYYVVISDVQGCEAFSDSIIPGFSGITETPQQAIYVVRYDAASSHLIISDRSAMQQAITVSLYDIAGKKFREYTIPGKPGSELRMETGRLTNGIYIVSLTAGDVRINQRIAVMRF